MEDGEVYGVAHLARARKQVERDVGNYVERLSGFMEVVLHGRSLGGLFFLSGCHLLHLAGWVACESEVVTVFSDVS